MGVNQIGIPRAQDGSHTARGCEIPVSAHSYGSSSDTGRAEPANEWRIRGGDYERLVTVLTLATREEIHLALAAAPFAAGVEVQDA
jgi:hypothetical protein